jgi:hypothetical protein
MRMVPAEITATVADDPYRALKMDLLLSQMPETKSYEGYCSCARRPCIDALSGRLLQRQRLPDLS